MESKRGHQVLPVFHIVLDLDLDVVTLEHRPQVGIHIANKVVGQVSILAEPRMRPGLGMSLAIIPGSLAGSIFL